MWTSNLSSVTPSRIYLMEYSKSPLKFIFRFKNFLETSSCALKKLYKLSPVLILSWYILPFTKWILSLFFWRTSLPYFDVRYSKNSSLLLLRTPTFYARYFNNFFSFSSPEKNFNWSRNFPLFSSLLILCTFETVFSSFSNIFGWWSDSNILFASGKTLLTFSENLTFFLVMAHSLLHYLYLLQV